MDGEENRSARDSERGPGESRGGGFRDASGGHDGGRVEEVVQATEQAAAGAEKEGGEKNPLHVKLRVYDGPLDLLLDLIKKNEMDIYDIPISEIARQYLDYLAEMKRLDLEIAGEFLVIAATLIYIKSRTLLPMEEETDDEDGKDPREELIRKLIEYQAFKEAAKELGLLETERGKIFTRQIADYYLADLGPDENQVETFSSNLYDLLSAFQKVLTRKGREGLHEVYEEVVSIEEKMAEIKARLSRFKRVIFSHLFGEKSTRNELIATFLALLEIVRSRLARVMQDEQFGEIVIERSEQVQS